MAGFAEPKGGTDGIKDYRFEIVLHGLGVEGAVIQAASVDIPSVSIGESRYQEGNNAFPAKIPGALDFSDVTVTKALFRDDTTMSQRFCQQVLALIGQVPSTWNNVFQKFNADVYVLDDATGERTFNTFLKNCFFKSLGYGGLNASSSGQLIMKSFTLSVQYVEIGGSTSRVSDKHSGDGVIA